MAVRPIDNSWGFSNRQVIAHDNAMAALGSAAAAHSSAMALLWEFK